MPTVAAISVAALVAARSSGFLPRMPAEHRLRRVYGGHHGRCLLVSMELRQLLVHVRYVGRLHISGATELYRTVCN